MLVKQQQMKIHVTINSQGLFTGNTDATRQQLKAAHTRKRKLEQNKTV